MRCWRSSCAKSHREDSRSSSKARITSPSGSSGLGIDQKVFGILPLPSFISPRSAIRCKRCSSSRRCLTASRGVSPDPRAWRGGFPWRSEAASERNSAKRLTSSCPRLQPDKISIPEQLTCWARIGVYAIRPVFRPPGGRASVPPVGESVVGTVRVNGETPQALPDSHPSATSCPLGLLKPPCDCRRGSCASRRRL